VDELHAAVYLYVTLARRLLRTARAEA